MARRTDFLKITVGLHKGLEHIPSLDGKIKFSNSFMQRLYDEAEGFRAKIMVDINDVIGLHTWAIQFVEWPDENPKFFADIWVDNTEHYPFIIGVIRSHIKEIEFSYYYKGDMDSYIDNLK